MADIHQIAAIYNSTPGVLVHHQGMDHIDTEVIRQERYHMALAGFSTCVSVEETLAIARFWVQNQEEVRFHCRCLERLSWNGKGSPCRWCIQKEMRTEGHGVIRMDVVDDYRGLRQQMQ